MKVCYCCGNSYVGKFANCISLIDIDDFYAIIICTEYRNDRGDTAE